MARTLHGRLLLVLAGLLVPMGVLFVAITLASARGYYQEITQEQNAGLAASLVEQSDIMLGSTVDQEKLKSLAEMLAMTNPNVEIYVLDEDGAILGGGTTDTRLLADRVELDAIETFLAGGSFPLRGTDPRRRQRTIFSAARLAGGLGYLYVVLTNEVQTSFIRNVQTSTVLRLSLWGSGVLLTILLLGGSLGFALLTRRLRRLRAAMTAFERSDLETVEMPLAPVRRSSDELDEVQNIFLRMVDRIRRQVGALRRADDQRRELVTNISHDLRTPLAALQGYLETLQIKHDSLTTAEQADYLSAARQHGERLDRLIAQLFELSRLDAEALPQIESFPLQELAHDVIQKFRIPAEVKGVALEVFGPTDLPFVIGDLGLIERALTNLIDNAIRHTPAGGTVTLRLEPTGERTIRVMVADTGEGIRSDALPRIFERFYQVPSAERPRGGSGLGLAIVKRIIELHGSSIEVESQPDKGARFWFELAPSA